MNQVQQSNCRKLRDMGYRFNETVQQGTKIVLRTTAHLLTGVTLSKTVAILDTQGRIEMGDVEY